MSGMSKIVKTMSDIIFPLIMIFGLYVIAHGHLTPGGGFQGGAVAASGCAMILIAYGSFWTVKKVKEKHLSTLESLGAFAFIGLGFLGLVFGSVFFLNFMANTTNFFNIFGSQVAFQNTAANINTAGVLPLMNLAVGLKVIAGLFVIVLVMAYATNKIKEGDID
ncbi:MAG: MnhB domain-containing protein [Promethearchaeota archaeon]